MARARKVKVHVLTDGEMAKFGAFRPKITEDLDAALEAVSVHEPAVCPPEAPKGWFGVSTDEAGGVVAYFATEKEAFRHRLDLINRLLNG